MELASQTVKRLQLELGGKNPVIILDDADLDMAVAAGVRGQTFNCARCVLLRADFMCMKVFMTHL